MEFIIPDMILERLDCAARPMTMEAKPAATKMELMTPRNSWECHKGYRHHPQEKGTYHDEPSHYGQRRQEFRLRFYYFAERFDYDLIYKMGYNKYKGEADN